MQVVQTVTDQQPSMVVPFVMTILFGRFRPVESLFFLAHYSYFLKGWSDNRMCCGYVFQCGDYLFSTQYK